MSQGFATDRAKFVINAGTKQERMINITNLVVMLDNNVKYADIMSDNRQPKKVEGNIYVRASTTDYILQDGDGYIDLITINYEDIPCSIVVQAASSSYVGAGNTVKYNGVTMVLTGVSLGTQDNGFNVNNAAERRANFICLGFTEFIPANV